jgi:hypothetical protein
MNHRGNNSGAYFVLLGIFIVFVIAMGVFLGYEQNKSDRYLESDRKQRI